MEGQQKHVAIKYFISDDCKIKYFFIIKTICRNLPPGFYKSNKRAAEIYDLSNFFL